MQRNHNTLIEDALSLAPATRAILAEQLLDSLNDPEQEEINRKWAEEGERRIQEIEEGKVKTISGKQVFQNIRERKDEL